MNMTRGLAILVLVLGVVAVVLGGIFVAQGMAKENLLVTAMQQEKITLGIPTEQLAGGEVIDTAKEAEIAGDTVREHRHSISPTYGDLLEGEKFNPTNPKQLTYAQALNLENYLYLAVLGFGVTQVVVGSGAFMIITGLALVGTGVALRRSPQRLQIKLFRITIPLPQMDTQDLLPLHLVGQVHAEDLVDAALPRELRRQHGHVVGGHDDVGRTRSLRHPFQNDAKRPHPGPGVAVTADRAEGLLNLVHLHDARGYGLDLL